MNESKCELRLPGFRFHPTEEELMSFYLKSMVSGKKTHRDIIGFLNIYNYHPSDLPRLAKIGEREWYFFVARERKHGNGGRPNRTTENGFWKATGSDKQILSTSDHPRKLLGLKKTLVFYHGRAPRGKKTDWIMNEYRLPPKCSTPKDIVLCKVYMKATSLKVLEQRAAMEEGVKMFASSDSSPSSSSSSSFSLSPAAMKEEESSKGRPRPRLVLPEGLPEMAELEVPTITPDWTQDSFWTQLSPWLDNFTNFVPLY